MLTASSSSDGHRDSGSNHKSAKRKCVDAGESSGQTKKSAREREKERQRESERARSDEKYANDGFGETKEESVDWLRC